MDTANPYASPAVPYGNYAPPAPAVSVSERTIQELEGTRPWVRFIAIMTWILSGLMVLFAVGMVAASLIGSNGAGMEAGAAIGLGVFYLLLAALMLYPAFKMTAYAKWIGSLSTSRSTADLENALQQQRLVWRFYGILMAIYLVFMVIAVAAAVVLPLLIRR